MEQRTGNKNLCQLFTKYFKHNVDMIVNRNLHASSFSGIGHSTKLLRRL